ncbi:MAG: site-specific integrase [Bacteroidetes bacterium]|nr:site-specific integrase [Bacteroidota bacterium]
MKESFSLRFYLHSSKAKGGKFQLYARIIVDREKVELASHLFIDPKQWDEQSGRTKKSSSVNDEIAEIENEIRKVRRKILDDNRKLSARLIKQYYKGEKNFKVKLLEYFKNHIDELTRYAQVETISPATVIAYNTTYKTLCSFLNEHKKIGDVGLSEVDYSLIHGLDIYLKTVYKDKQGNNISTNYANKQHSRVRTILHKAVREGIIAMNPYIKLKLKKEKTSRERLTELELELLKSHSLSDNVSLDRVRDFFLFSCYTGLRYEDAYNLKMDDITKEPDGTCAINIVMGKTDDRVYVPILEPARQIIAKYEQDDARKVFNYVLPRYSNQKINVYLKTISELTGINKDLTHHVARHTCATYLLNSGVPIEVVQNILGHSDLKTTKIYAKMLNSTVKEQMKKVNEKLKVA